MTGPIERALARALQNRSANRTSAPASSEPTSQLETTANSTVRPRVKVHVNSLSERYATTKWMIEQAAIDGPKHVISKAVQRFPSYFSGNMKANIMKASRWWRARDQKMALKEPNRRLGKMVSHASHGAKRARFKALGGRGRKQSPWVNALYDELVEEFDRFKTVGVKLSTSVLQYHAISLMKKVNPECLFYADVEENGVKIVTKFTHRWVQRFMIPNDIVLRSQTGKLLTSPAKEEYIEKTEAFHMGELKRGFMNGLLNENRVENADETHFVFNMDNGKTLGLRGDTEIKYVDVVSGGDPITMTVRITGGANARIEAPFLIFQNKNRSYPIRGVPDNVPGVSYRSGPKGWMDSQVWVEWLSEKRAIKALPYQQRRILYVDNYGSHVNSGDARAQLKRINTTIQKFPANATHLVQPTDSFVIQKIKDVWRRRWDNYKMDAVNREDWMGDGHAEESGKLKNPGKNYFLRLAVEAVQEDSSLRDSDGVQYARKAMIRTGMGLNLNGLWEESQLSLELQAIIAKHRIHFDGMPVE